MGDALTPPTRVGPLDEPLDARVRRVLLREWNPAGVGDDALGAARYACQVQDVTLLLYGDAAPAELADYLRLAETTRFGAAAADERRLERVAGRLRALVVGDD